MEELQYGISDLRQYIGGGKPFFPAISPPPDLLSCHRPHPNYDMLIFRSDPTPNNIVTGFEMEAAGGGGGGGGDGGGTARWPRQETLTLLEIRSRLDPKFKEANQKGPLWDEVSRIMSEEYGYQRSGKKCREKFENLYKYYKKTKEGKAGRQDGKHYRFFRQLEALYGEPTHSSSASETHFNGATFPHYFPANNPSLPSNQEPYPKLSDSSDYDTTSSDSNDVARNKKRRGKRSLNAKIRDSIDAQMKKLMEKQEAWMEKMMSIIDHKERERMMREEQWRKQDAARIDREHKMWADERAWIEARDITLMDAFQKLTGKELRVSAPVDRRDDVWPESEITRLIQLRNGLDLKFQENRISTELLWDEIATKMGCYGYERSGLMCEQKWDSVNNYLLKCNKKRKENSKFESINSYEGVAGIDHGDSINESCFRYFIGDAYGRL